MAKMRALPRLNQITLFLLPLLLILVFLYKRFSRIQKPGNLPRSPPKLPIIGNLHQVGEYPHRTLFTLSKKYGEIMFLQLGKKATIVISSARLASQVLRAYDVAFSGRPEYAIGKSMFYGQKDVILGSYGEHWRHMRSVCVLQLLTNKRVQSFKRVREEEVALMVSNIRKTSSSMVNLTDMFMLLTSNVICKVAFGRKCNEEIDGINFPMILKDLAQLFGSSNIEDVLPWMAWVNWVNGVNFRITKLTRLFDGLMEKILQEHLNCVEGARAHDSGDNADMTDFVNILLEAQRDTNPRDMIIDNDSIKGVLMDMFAAGTHTASLTMEWAFTEILRHPRVMERLQQEVRGIVGDKESVYEDEDLEKMIYLKAVIKETLRLHPPLPFLVPRECIEDVKIDGYDVFAGTQVLINAWAIGRDPMFWEEADTFSPERFLNSKIDVRGHDFQVIPFGSGRRMCPGISFGMANIEIVLANIIHQFDWEVPLAVEKQTLDTTETPGLTSHKQSPLVVIPLEWTFSLPESK